MTLSEFLAARLGEDEAAAREAFYAGQRWITEEEGVYRYPVFSDPANPAYADQELVQMADRKRDARHIARWDPARVLREVDAKRKILAAWVAADTAMREGDDTRWRVGEVFGLRGAVVILAAAWSDHPDYDPAWAS